VLLVSGLLTACISLASTLPGPAHKSGEDMGSSESTMLPRMMDSSAAYPETGTAAPIAGQESGARMEAPESAPMHARVASGDSLPAASPQESNGSNGQSCVPEPVSVLLMAGGLLGLICARRFSPFQKAS
jgi:hypothetical protein